MATNASLIPPYEYEGPQQNHSQPAPYGQNMPYGQKPSHAPTSSFLPPPSTPQPYAVSPMSSPAFNQSQNPAYNAYNPSAFRGPPQPYGNPMNKQQQQQQQQQQYTAFAPPSNAPPTPAYSPTGSIRPPSVFGAPSFPPPPGRPQSSYFPPPANAPPTPQYTPTPYGQPVSPQSTGASYFPQQPQSPPATQQPYGANSPPQVPYGQPILTPQSTGSSTGAFNQPQSSPPTQPALSQEVSGPQHVQIELPAVRTPVSATDITIQAQALSIQPGQEDIQSAQVAPLQVKKQEQATAPSSTSTISPTHDSGSNQERQAPQIQQPQPIEPPLNAQAALIPPPLAPNGQVWDAQQQGPPPPPPNSAPPQARDASQFDPSQQGPQVPLPPNSAPPQQGAQIASHQQTFPPLSRDPSQFGQQQAGPQMHYQQAQSTIYGYNSTSQQPQAPPPYSPPTQPLQNPPQMKYEYQPQSPPVGQPQTPQSYGQPQTPQSYGSQPQTPQPYGIQGEKQQFQTQTQQPFVTQAQAPPPLYSHQPGVQVISQQQTQTSAQQLGAQYGIPVQQAAPQVMQGKDEQHTGKVKRFMGDTLVGRFARSSVSTVTTTIKMPSVLSPWGDNNPVTLPNVRYRDAVLFGTFAVIGAPLVDGIADGVASSFGADHFVSEIVSSGAGFITGNTIVKYGVFQIVEQAIDKGILEKVLPDVEKTMRTTSAKTLQVAIKHKLMGVDADIQFVGTYPAANRMACDKGWFCPYLFASSRTPMIPRDQDWAMAQFFRPYLAADTLLTHKLLTESPSTIPLCDPNPTSQLPYARLLVTFLGLSPLRGESAGMWSQSRRPGCGNLRIHLLNGCPAIVVPVSKQRAPVIAWSPWTLAQMQSGGGGVGGGYTPQIHHQQLCSYLLELVDRTALLNQLKPEGGAAPGSFERVLGKAVQMIMNGAINAPRSCGKVVGVVDAERAGVVCLRY